MTPHQLANISAAISLITGERWSKNLQTAVDLLIDASEEDDDEMEEWICECDTHRCEGNLC